MDNKYILFLQDILISLHANIRDMEGKKPLL
jgi:hypothetical protein